ncbi:MAG: hypothetical protein ACTXOO_03435 [Sodalis sp. (in: enterobacteria)]
MTDFVAQINHQSVCWPDIASRIYAQRLEQFIPATTAWIGELMPKIVTKAPAQSRLEYKRLFLPIE